MSEAGEFLGAAATLLVIVVGILIHEIFFADCCEDYDDCENHSSCRYHVPDEDDEAGER